MKVAIIAMFLLIFPVALLASPTLGVYFGFPGMETDPLNFNLLKMTYSPSLYEDFDGYLYARAATGCWISGIEYAMAKPDNVDLLNWDLPEGAIDLGGPLDPEGHAIVLYPPMNGSAPGYNLLCTFHFEAADDCAGTGDLGGLTDALLVITETSNGYLRGTCWPDNHLINYVGMTSVFCPTEIATKDASWGAIKSLF